MRAGDGARPFKHRTSKREKLCRKCRNEVGKGSREGDMRTREALNTSRAAGIWVWLSPCRKTLWTTSELRVG